MINKILTFVGMFSIWTALSYPLSSNEVIYGVILSVLLTIVASVYNKPKQGIKFNSIFAFVKYIIVLMIELVKANVNVAKIVLNPKLPISPKVFKVKTELKSKIAQTLLANSITLTPGTISIELDKDTLYIHSIEGDKVEDPMALKSPFEELLKEVFEK